MQAWKAGGHSAMARAPAPTGEQIARAWVTARACAGRQCKWAQLQSHPFPDDIAEQMRREEALLPEMQRP
eukprot:7206542-Pyramimonas_sp.AAC.1